MCYNILMVIYFDTETSNFTPGSICQLSYIMDDGNKVTGKNFFFAVDYVSAGAYSVHKFSVSDLERLSGGKRFEHFSDEILKDFQAADLLIAHNLPFDLRFMMKEFERLDTVFNYNATLCSMRKFTSECRLKKKSGSGYKYPSLQELGRHFEVYIYDVSMALLKIFGTFAEAHDARHDTALLYLAMKSAASRNEILRGQLGYSL